MTEKIVQIDNQEVRFRASASVPRLYRIKFKRDIFKDLSRLQQSFEQSSLKKSQDKNGASSLEIEDLEIFENVAYIMAYHADPSIPPTIDEWLEQFGMFSIYEVLPEILDLWGANMQADVTAKKNSAAPTGK